MTMGFIHFTGSYTDQYELAMAEVYFKCGRKEETAVFDYFFRKLPLGSGFVLFSGLHDLLEILEHLCFSQQDLNYLAELNFDSSFLNYLSNFSFSGDIHACAEGEIVFPGLPILRVEGNLIELQIIETLLLNILNYQSLIATKAARLHYAAKDRKLVEFGLRRAPGAGGYSATRAALIGGCDGTSHVKAAADLGLHATGTMAHSFIQSEKDELTAFRNFARCRPEDCVLLIDTYSTLKSGLPNAIKVALEMKESGQQLKGIRLDSGPLGKLSRECRQKLDEAGLHEVKIVASNQIDELIIEALLQEGAPIDIFGVGSKLVTGYPDGSLDGVYKLCEIDGLARIKISEDKHKINLPHRKQILRLIDERGNFIGMDLIALADEEITDSFCFSLDSFVPVEISQFKRERLQHLQMEKGKRVNPVPSIAEIKLYVQQRLAKLPEEFRLLKDAKIYQIGLSSNLKKALDEQIRLHEE